MIPGRESIYTIAKRLGGYPPMLTTEQASELTGIGPDTLRRRGSDANDPLAMEWCGR